MLDPSERVWEAFTQSESTLDGRHDTPYWRSHAGPYASCVIRVEAACLQSNLNLLRRDVSRLEGLRFHPDHFLHIMLQELGFVVDAPTHPDELSPARLEEFTQATVGAIASLNPATFTVGGVNSFQDAVFLQIDPSQPLRVIHERLFDLAAIPRIPTYPYLPHCTIAHYDGTVRVPDAVSVLMPWRDINCGEIEVTEIEIVTLDPSEPYPELQSYAVIPLGA